MFSYVFKMEAFNFIMGLCKINILLTSNLIFKISEFSKPFFGIRKMAYIAYKSIFSVNVLWPMVRHL
jgi:hypothetical protein